MPAHWKKQAEIEKELAESQKNDNSVNDQSIKNSTEPDGAPPINIEFKDDDEYQRTRSKSTQEKMFKGIETFAVGYAKVKLKLKKYQAKRQGKDLNLEEETAKVIPKEERETFRNLISFVFSDQYLEEFLSVMQALGFKPLGGFEYLGRRDADYSIAKDLDENNRLHFRAYRIKGNIYVLAHHEPKATQDIGLHIKGFFDRILANVIAKEKNPEVKIDNDAGSPEDGQKIELSNYEKGTDIFLKMLKETVPNFYRKLNTSIHDADLALWKEYMGIIDHLSPEDLIIENLIESSRLIPPFTQIRDTIKKIFEALNFECIPAWDLKVNANDKYFIAKSINAQHDFEILIISEDFIDEIMRTIGLLRAKYQPKFIILISPDISLFGPEPDDVPPPDIEIPKHDPQRVKDLLNFLADANVSVFPVSLIIDFFRMHQKTPWRYSHIELLLKNKGLLKSEMLQEILQEHDTYQKFISDVLAVFAFYQKSPKGEWVSLKKLEKQIKTTGLELNATEMNNIMKFMENPLLELMESKNNKREDYRIIPSLSDEDIEFKVKKMKTMLEEYLVEQKSTQSYL